RERMAARTHAMDKVFFAAGRFGAITASAVRNGDLGLRDRGRRPDLPHAAPEREPRNHWPGCREALAIVADPRRRHFPGAAAVRPRRQGDHLHRLERSARTDRARLAPRLAAQARRAKIAAVPAL